MIVLGKLSRQTQRLELVRTKYLGEETAIILENLRDEYADIAQVFRFNP